LACDREDDEIPPFAVLGGGAHDDGGSALGGRLGAEGERDEDQVAELRAGHGRRRQSSPRPWRRRPRRADSPRA
jgi:hypothetical protein